MKTSGVVIPAFVLTIALCLAGCGGGGASQDELDQARKEGAQQAKNQAKLDSLQKRVDDLSKGASQVSPNGGGYGGGTGGTSTSPIVSGATDCGGGVSAGANTSCDFALNVAGEFGSNPGSGTLRAYSPVTGQYYTMNCSAYGTGHVCSGGDNASVYLP